MNIKLYNSDCLKILPKLKSDSVDLIITDPPYYVLTKQSWDQQWKSLDEYFSWFDNVFNEMWRVLKNGGQLYVYFSQKYMYEYGQRYHPKRMLVWHHKNLAQPTNGMYLWTYDPIFYHVKGEKPNSFHASFVNRTNVDVLEFSKPQRWRGHIRWHPAEKNLELSKILIQNSSDKDDIVLDPFAGSGTTILAAKLLNRKAIGIEKQKKYFNMIFKRLKLKI